MEETLQDRRLVAPYVANNTRTSKLAWPEPKLLQDLAIDNTVLVTAATCSYAPLVINWCPTHCLRTLSNPACPPSVSLTRSSGLAFTGPSSRLW